MPGILSSLPAQSSLMKKTVPGDQSHPSAQYTSMRPETLVTFCTPDITGWQIAST
ncbi:MAG: hypothetical protein H7833_20805 [Magnetococcus sp. DMHC-1]|nr:hypothetical protein [Magnetococcales bacterium]